MVARIEQISGSKTSGYWTPLEHLSFLIKSSPTSKALPDLKGVRGSHPRFLAHQQLPRQELHWCPVNDVAATRGDLPFQTVRRIPFTTWRTQRGSHGEKSRHR